MTLQTAVIGHPISHSLSPALHNAIFKNEGIDACMEAFDVEDIGSFIPKIREVPYGLVAVTLPHKLAMMQLVDEVDPVARGIGAVNTVVNRDGTLFGYNTDIVGVAATFANVALDGKKALIIGAGGAAQPLAYHLAQNGASFSCYSRELDRTSLLCERFGGTPLESLSAVSDVTFDVIINATPLGLKRDDPLPVPADMIRKGSIVFDLLYMQTPFQKEAKERGATVISGLPMFVAQGLEQEKLWLGRAIPDSGYTAMLQDILASKTL